MLKGHLQGSPIYAYLTGNNLQKNCVGVLSAVYVGPYQLTGKVGLLCYRQGRIQTKTNGGLQVDHAEIGGSGDAPQEILKKFGIFGIFKGGGGWLQTPKKKTWIRP